MGHPVGCLASSSETAYQLKGKFCLFLEESLEVTGEFRFFGPWHSASALFGFHVFFPPFLFFFLVFLWVSFFSFPPLATCHWPLHPKPKALEPEKNPKGTREEFERNLRRIRKESERNQKGIWTSTVLVVQYLTRLPCRLLIGETTPPKP